MLKRVRFVVFILCLLGLLGVINQERTLAEPGPNGGTTYLVDTDNENNAGTGLPDGDMGGSNPPCVFKTNSIAPIELNIDVTGPLPTQDAVLTLRVYDVDEPAEVDEVYFNGNLVGVLTGADNTFSTNVITLDPSMVQAGLNRVEIVIDIATTGSWCVELHWAQLVLDGGSPALGTIDAMGVNYCYPVSTAPITVDVNYALDIFDAGNFELETTFIDPNNTTLDQDTYNFAGTTGPLAYMTSFTLDPNAALGTYTVNGTLLDVDTNLIQDVHVRTIEYATVCTPTDVTVSSLGGSMAIGSQIGLMVGLLVTILFGVSIWKKRHSIS